ncbi:hypothetical protein [Arthrobacter methylotrophus]|uniref:DUF3093 domain-containing protein n=1 Tax=Arthrobacter methylotrophus TaxID=121291 RepID=A0ABV5UQB1_9MICC
MSALAAGILLPGLLVAAGIVAVTWTIVRMTVSIATAEEKIVVRCAPFYSTEIPISEVSAVTTARDTSLSEGYGIRILEKKTRGVLVGGPAISLETVNRRWIISTAHPEEVASTIRDHMSGK